MDCSIFLIWNVRGLNARARRDNVRIVVDCIRPTMVCLQETKLATISNWDILAFLGPAYHNFVYLPAQNTRGGILVAWRDGVFSVDHWRVHQHSVSIKFQEGDQPAW